MASITVDIDLDTGAHAIDPDAAWRALRDFAHADRAFPGVLVACDADAGATSRTVTFADGTRVEERLVDLDDHRRRLAYTVVGGTFEHHHATFTVTDRRISWTTDLLPDAAAPIVEGFMRRGLAALTGALRGVPR